MALLRQRHAAGAADVALYVTMVFAGPAVIVDAFAHVPISPEVGDEGSAE